VKVVMLLRQYPPDYSGSGLQAARLANQLAARGLDVVVLTTRPAAPGAAGGEAAAAPSRVSLRRFRAPSGRRLRDLALGLQAAAWLAVRSGWEVLHIHGYSHFAVLPTWVARLRRRPVVVKTTLLGGDDPAAQGRGLLGRWILAGYGASSAIIPLSRELAAGFERAGRFPGCVEPIPNGVDTACFRPAGPGERDRLRARFGLPTDACIVVMAGGLIRRKNPLGLVEAAGRVRHRPLCLALAGPSGTAPGEPEELELALKRLPADVTVRQLGQLDGESMAELLRACDVFALPSRAEGLPNALLEAMASGLACVATDIPGSRDVLEHGGGELLPLDDPESLAAALERLAADPEARRRLGEQARSLVEARYSIESVAERYEALYRRLVRSGP
jgi:glycosyltransferase involved in cell wall biosynthesis